MVSVLLIDDDTELSKLLEEYLQSEQFELHSAHDGPSGSEQALANHYSAVVLDVMLPGMRELVARLRAILRRSATGATPSASQPVHLAGVDLHPDSRSVTCNGKPVALTGAEFDLLYSFLRSPGKIISRED